MKRIYISAAAQFGNLGDLVLRSTAIEWASGATSRVHVFVGGAPDEYVRALQLPASARLYTSLVRFYCAFLFAPGHMWWSPGEQTLRYRRKELIHGLLALLSAGYARTRGYQAVKIGRSYSPVGGGPLLPLERLLSRLLTVHVLRDDTSAALMPRARVLPDLALSSKLLRQPNAKQAVMERAPRGVISLRGDRPMAAADVRRMVQRLAELDLDWDAVSQVERDRGFNAELAGSCHGRVYDWNANRTEHLAELLATYQRSALVVSDRLHVILFAVAMDAPVMGIDSGSGKMRRHLAVLGLEGRCFTPTELVGLPDDKFRELQGRSDVQAARTAAQARLDEARREMATATPLRAVEPGVAA